MAKLVVVKGLHIGQEYIWHPKSELITIGRGGKNDFKLQDEAVSRHHATILSDNGQLVIKDAGSSYGVLVNNKRVERKALENGDEIGLGNELLVFYKHGFFDLDDEISNADTIAPLMDATLKGTLKSKVNFSSIIGASPSMRKVFALMEKACSADVADIPVMILGETGTGKELVANEIHKNSPRKAAYFIAQNCAAIPENMLESELFGYKRGAFTGADSDKPGLFEAADHGTLFLDEIADASLATQAKLLRAVELGEIRRLGENLPRRVDVRITSAANRDLEEAIKASRFREDLYFRLNSLTIKLPPLRERRGDILLLASFFLKKYNEQFNKGLLGLAQNARAALLTYDWRGNVRQLESIIRTAVLLFEGKKGENLISHNDISAAFGIDSISEKFRNSLDETLDVIEEICIKEALAQTNNNISESAKLLSTNRKRIQRRLNEWRKESRGAEEPRSRGE